VARILLADDEANIREVVQYALERDGFTVEHAADGEAALARLRRGGIDLVILDVLMPELDGLSVCRALRAEAAGASIPIVFLSSRGDEHDRILGLELGGDDYVSKPFSPRELASRVKAVLRRTADRAEPRNAGAAAAELLVRGRLRLDLRNHEATVDGDARLSLTVTEFRLLASLLEQPGRVLTRHELIARAYDDNHHITARTVDTHIRHVRAKLAAHGLAVIETAHGLGYKGA
jgi:two-component system OmpR family response regulator